MYKQGLGTAQDLNTSAIWLKAAADKQHTHAAYKFARHLSSADYHDYPYYSIALDGYKEILGDPEQMKNHIDGSFEYRLAKMYEKGLGTPPSYEDSQYFLKIAADKGHVAAQYSYANNLRLYSQDFEQ